MNTQESSFYKNQKIVFLFGPTAVGKTALLQTFFADGYEVVNADSVQVYKKLDVGSAKIGANAVPRHHMIDILEPDEAFNVATFIRLADEACQDIISRGNIPVISGGTAYYFKHFLYGLSEAPEVDPAIRNEVSSWIRSVGKEEAHRYLITIDEVSAGRINANDLYRVSRAIEVYRQTGRPLSSFKMPVEPRGGMRPLIIGLYREKSQLDERIRKRVDIMFDEGLMDEIRYLVSIGADSSWQSMQAIGYREFIGAIEEELTASLHLPDTVSSEVPLSGKDENSSAVHLPNKEDNPVAASLAEAENSSAVHLPNADVISSRLSILNSLDINKIKEEIVMNSIHYAKRQNTFFKSFKDVNWVHPEDTETLKKLLEVP